MPLSVLACLSLETAAARHPNALPPIPERSGLAAEKRAKLEAIFRRGLGPTANEYLERRRGKNDWYLPPSEIDPRFTIALYVNTAASGPRAQRMWVLQREPGFAGRFRLALWDKRYWRRKHLPDGMRPPYSWLVSTGRKYAGDAFSGPTPQGIFSIDERRGRLVRGYAARGMINAVFIDFHYRSGRRSGVAFHGTTPSLYRRLGRIDSHGCIRMTIPNAKTLLDRLQGRDGVLDQARRWGEVPRFWRHQRGGARFGYRRNGRAYPRLPSRQSSLPPRLASSAGAGIARDPRLADVLTKVGYRAIVVMFAGR